MAASANGAAPELSEAKPEPLSWDKEASIRLRILRAQHDVSVLTQDAEIKGKTKEGHQYSYKGITAAQIIARAKAALIANGVLYTPEEAEDKTLINGNKTSLWIVGHFENVDNPEDKLVRGAWGSGTDNADNGYAKAFTNANKQILSKTLQMTTVEDDTPTEVPHETEPKTAAMKEAEALTEATLRSWGDAYKAALDGCKTLKDLKRIRAENANMMNHPGVPQVTKDYFIDKITALQDTLE